MVATETREPSRTEHLPEHLWISMLLRALPALIGAIIITFNANHSARFGLLVFGAVLVVSGILVGFEAVGIKGHPARGLVYARSLITVVTGGVALFMSAATHDYGDARMFIILVAVWGIVTGGVELAAAAVCRKHRQYAGEILISGALTLLIGVAVALVPPDLFIAYGGKEQVTGSMDASIASVGLVGAYFAVLGVLLVIEAFTLRTALRQGPNVRVALVSEEAAK